MDPGSATIADDAPKRRERHSRCDSEAKPLARDDKTASSAGLIVGVGGNPRDQTHVPPGFNTATGAAVAIISRTRLLLPESSPSP